MRIFLLILGVISLYGCSNAPGRPVSGEMPAIPGEISDFKILYAQNCAGCHGAEGKGGAAIALANPAYLAVADDVVLQSATAKGISGTSMPAFAQSAGGMLTTEQVDVIVKGIREGWSKPNLFQGADPPPYKSTEPGDGSRGAEVYATYCSSCHGADGRGGPKAGSIVAGSFLSLAISSRSLLLSSLARRIIGIVLRHRNRRQQRQKHNQQSHTHLSIVAPEV